MSLLWFVIRVVGLKFKWLELRVVSSYKESQGILVIQGNLELSSCLINSPGTLLNSPLTPTTTQSNLLTLPTPPWSAHFHRGESECDFYIYYSSRQHSGCV